MAEEYISVLLSVYTNGAQKKTYLCFVSFIYVLCSHFVAQQAQQGLVAIMQRKKSPVCPRTNRMSISYVFSVNA